LTPIPFKRHFLIGEHYKPTLTFDEGFTWESKGEDVAAPDVNGVISARSDEDLITLILEEDPEAFTHLYERYFKRIYHFVNRRMNNSADVEETVQEVFINVFSSLDGYRHEAPFVAWIFGVTRRTIASRFKKKQHPMVSLEEEHADTASMDIGSATMMPPSAIETIEYKQRITTIGRLVKNRLTREQQVLFELHHLQERPIQEIAQTLNKSENAIKSNLYRTRKILLAV
jgi:RNA polymerase sigma factor (sigma-70 family)